MATNKKATTFIPEVDRIKAGAERVDPLKDIRGDDGYVRMTRTKSGNEARNKAITREIAEQQEKLASLKAIAESYGMSKKDIKETKEDIEDDDYERERKEEKKKEKKNQLMDPYFASLMGAGAIPSDFASFLQEGGEKGEKKKKKKKKKKDKERAKIAGMTVKDKDDKKKKKHKDKPDEDEKNRSEVAERFREVEKISRTNLKEIDNTLDLIDNRLNEITSNGDRMKSKDYIIANYLSTKSSLISSRQKIATDIGANRAKIYEIEMKREKNSKEGAASDADMIARLFPGIALGGSTNAIAKYVSESGKNKDSKKKKKHKDWDDDDYIRDDDLDAREKALLKSGDLEYSDYDKNIEFEGTFRVAVKKSYTTGEWKFVAIDEDGQIIRDFPKSHLPSRKQASMKFDDENDTCRDSTSNNVYPVIQVPSL